MSQKMPAVVHYDQKDGAVELRDVRVPTIGKEDALLEVRSVSVCGSDVHMWRDKLGHKPRVPVILGHEFSGVVAQAGKRVQGFKEGDRVASETRRKFAGSSSSAGPASITCARSPKDSGITRTAP